MNGQPIATRRLHQSDANTLIALRLKVAADDEVAMGASFAEEKSRPVQSFRDQLAPQAPSTVFGTFVGDELVAAAGILQSSMLASSAHKMVLWGVVVSPNQRRRGYGRLIVDTALIRAFASGARRVNLSVYVPNEAAVRLYSSKGFKPYGTEPDAHYLAGRFYDAQLMSVVRDEA